MHLTTKVGVVEVSTITEASSPFVRGWETCVFWPHRSEVVYLSATTPEKHHEQVVSAIRLGDLEPSV